MTRPTDRAGRSRPTLLRFRSRSPLTGGLLLPALLALGACGGSESGETSNVFQVGTSDFGVAAQTPLEVQGEWLAFLVDEAASGLTPLNTHDSDVNDQVAVVVNTRTKTERNLRVATESLQWLGSELYLVVDETLDNHDWSGDFNVGDLVLLHWNTSLDDPVFVDTLDPASPRATLAVGNTLFYASDHATAVAGESSLLAIDRAFPTTPRPVFTQDVTGGLTPRLLEAQDGLLFLALDETVAGDGRELNGDGDMDDAFVLALLDGSGDVDAGGYEHELRNTGLAITDDETPLRAVFQGANNWIAAFLVDELAQGESLNRFGGGHLPLSWQVAGCAVDDVDTDDQVLFGIRFAAWDADPTTEPPINTGLAGGARVLIVGDAIATICLESDESDCAFNGDGDPDDGMLRWMRLDGPAPLGSNNGPARSVGLLLALDLDLPGPAMAVGELDGAFVIQVDEAEDGRDWDGNVGSDRELVAWLDPQAGSPQWRFDHGSGDPAYATATWMGELPGRTRLGVAYAESSNGLDLNGDGDQDDAVPTFADLVGGSPGRLSFPGLSTAVDKDNAGISLSNGWGFFRVSEAEEGGDINGNGQMDDFLLVRLNLTSGDVASMGALNTLERPGVETEPDGISPGAAYITDEMIIGANVSGDNDADDLVVRFFRLP